MYLAPFPPVAYLSLGSASSVMIRLGAGAAMTVFSNAIEYGNESSL